MTNVIEWCYKHRVPYNEEMFVWIRDADITTMDEFWSKCDRGDWMLCVLAECTLGQSAEMSRLEFVVRCAERALAKAREEGHELDPRARDAIEAAKGVVDGVMDEDVVWEVADDAENIPYCDHPVVEAATEAAMYAVDVALRAVTAGSIFYTGHICAFHAAQSSVLAIAGSDKGAENNELRWQADTLRALLQPSKGK